MKHPNKKIENTCNSMAKRRMNSCFKFWIKPNGMEKINLNINLLMESLQKINNG